MASWVASSLCLVREHLSPFSLSAGGRGALALCQRVLVATAAAGFALPPPPFSASKVKQGIPDFENQWHHDTKQQRLKSCAKHQVQCDEE
mmetsp:Transcript_19644/g.28919  ORF Transcript_19644/g.28919 Transcript_19644/m.28919 type:complete len:90 (+) Transcript_19644:13-282(+)